MAIRVLEEPVIAQIAAGEVIERPASVVKELVENALDAGATSIQITTDSGGRRLIRVNDDGSGIPTAEVGLAFMRHATSKLTAAEDLYHIRTLGFRGEALASIAAVSRLSAITRSASDHAGTLIQIEGGRVLQHNATGAPIGTSITVENLFFNTPARLKFLKAETTEKRHIATVISRYAMAYPQVRFILEQDGRETFRANGTGQLSDVLIAGLGLDQFRDMIEVNGEDDTGVIRVRGYTSAPHSHRSDRSRMVLFVNGRWIQDPSLTYAIIQAYHTFLMNGRYPVAVLLITLPSEDVDVNVHPTKAEVRFRDPNGVFSAVQRAVRRAVVDGAQAPQLRSTPRAAWAESGTTATDRQLDMPIHLESTGGYRHQRPEETWEADNPTAIPEGPLPPAQPRTLPMLRVIGQIGASYIVTEGPAGMYLIDQHAAHERILYEQFMMEFARKGPLAQFTLDAQMIDLPAPEARLIEEHLDALSATGFKLEPFGTNTFLVRSIPAILSDRDPIEIIHQITEDLERGDSPGGSAIEEKIIKRVCKQAAVKAGTILSLEQMRSLIQQLERCQSPHTCPHGRPTLIHMSSDHISREFGRK